MSENLIIPIAREADVVSAIESLGIDVQTEKIGDARMLTCRRDKATIKIRISQPSQWAGAPVVRDHAIAVVMVGSLFHRSEAGQLREDVVAVCAPFIVAMDDLVERARAATGTEGGSGPVSAE